MMVGLRVSGDQARGPMSRLSRNLLCIAVGVIFSGLGGLLVAISWPLLFPLRLQSSSRGEDAVGIGFLVFYVLFANYFSTPMARQSYSLCLF